MKFFTRAILLVVLAATACGQVKKEPSPPPVNREAPRVDGGLKMTYIANMGVLISSGDKRVLIDAIHRKYKPAYVFPPPELLSALESAQAPYDRIALILVSHTHLDHFHPESVALHLRSDPKSVLVSSAQVIGEMPKSEEISARLKEVTPEVGKRIDLEINGIKLALLGLRHVNTQHRSVQNLGYLVEIGGKKVLHVGDAELTAENFSAFQLHKENIEVAILPQWFLDGPSGCETVRNVINAKHLIATHISSGYTDEASSQIKKNCAGADAFTKILEERNY